MSTDRLNASVEASSIIRRASVEGDFAAILRKGDPERGALVIVVRSRGRHFTVLERQLGVDGRYEWGQSGPSDDESGTELTAFLEKKARFDPDMWLIELDVAHPERFVAETTQTS